MPRLVPAAVGIALLALPATAHAQVALGVRFGQGEGTGNYSVGEVHGRVRAVGPVHVTATLQTIGGNWDCPALPTATGCGYDGTSLSLGAALAAVDERAVYLAVGADVGGFIRDGSFAGTQNEGDRHVTARVAFDAEVAVWGPLRLQVSVAHRRIFDGPYERTYGEVPHLTSLTGGLSVVLWRGSSHRGGSD